MFPSQKFYSILLVFTCLFFNGQTKAHSFSFTSENTSKDFIEDISFVKDNNYTIEKLSQLRFKTLKNPKISHENGVYWFKIQLDTLATLQKSIVFDLKEPTIEAIELYSNSLLITTQKTSLGHTAISIQLDNPSSTQYFVKALLKDKYIFH
jgi:hypothetical protein